MRLKTALVLVLTTLLGAGVLPAQENRRSRSERGGERTFERSGRSDRGAWGDRGGWGGRERRGATERASYAPLELHGMIGSGDSAQVSISNPETGESQWVRVRDSKAKWYVESANPKSRSVVVRLDGMALKLEMITNTGEPMSIAPQPTPLSADEAAAEGALVGVNTGFDAKSIASQMMAARASGQPPTPEQMQAFGEQIRAMSPEQRTQVFSELRQMRQATQQAQGGNAAYSGNVSVGNGTLALPASTSVSGGVQMTSGGQDNTGGNAGAERGRSREGDASFGGRRRSAR